MFNIQELRSQIGGRGVNLITVSLCALPVGVSRADFMGLLTASVAETQGKKR